MTLTATLYEVTTPLILPTLTRGILFREDWLSATGAQTWTLDSGVIITSDGDNATITGLTASNGATANTGATGTTTGANRLLLRGASPTGAATSFDAKITYADTSTETFTLTLGAAGVYVTNSYLLAANKNLNTSTIKLLNAQPSGASVLVDMALIFKELLTLPAVFEPLRPIKNRRVAVLPILGREGGVVQDLGSIETDLSITGGLLTTSQYTADNWWHVFDGLVLEAGIFQLDGNETWQWFDSDLVDGKFSIISWVPGQVMGRIAYHDYTLSLKRFDVVGETASMIGAIQ